MNIKNTINPDYALIKSYMTEDDKRTTVKLDYKKGAGYLPPIVSPIITSYIVSHSGKLVKATRILANDTVLQNYIFKPVIGEIDDDKLNQLNQFWNKKNKYQFSLAVQEYHQYGYGCCEILLDENGVPFELAQFPAQTAVIRKVGDCFYAVQRGVQDGEKRLRLFQDLSKYPEEDDDLPICLWIGGGTTHEYYDMPAWYPERDQVLARINLNMLNADQLNNGNNIDGVLNIFGPPQRPNPQTNETPEDRLKKQMKSAGTGTVVNYMESATKDFPLTMEYVRIGNDNWDYLKQLAESCDNDIMSMYSIPHIRMMIDDAKESMNSNKSDTIWEIYTVELNYQQFPNELMIQEFNKWAFDVDYEVEMEVPIFSDKRQIELDSTSKLFQSGLLTIGQAIQKIQPLMTDVDFTKIDFNAPHMKERFYNGNPIGVDEDDSMKDLVEWLQGAI